MSIQVQPNWIMQYFAMVNTSASCGICGAQYRMFGTLIHFKRHIMDQHRQHYLNYIWQGYDGESFVWQIFYITEYDNAKCLLCDYIHHVPTSVLKQIKMHLIYTHVRDTLYLQNWLNAHFDYSSFGQSRCVHCDKICVDQYGSLTLFAHVSIDHNITAPPGIETTRMGW